MADLLFVTDPLERTLTAPPRNDIFEYGEFAFALPKGLPLVLWTYERVGQKEGYRPVKMGKSKGGETFWTMINWKKYRDEGWNKWARKYLEKRSQHLNALEGARCPHGMDPRWCDVCVKKAARAGVPDTYGLGESFIVEGAHGNSYTSMNAAIADWRAGKDFRVLSMHQGTYMSCRDVKKNDTVEIRYGKNRGKVLYLGQGEASCR